MKSLLVLALTTISVSSFAEPKPCENMAKASAIRTYKAEVGTVQGSDGIEYSATLTGIRGNVVSYLVDISDNNEDGEYWTVSYSVVLQQNNGCKVLQTKRMP